MRKKSSHGFGRWGHTGMTLRFPALLLFSALAACGGRTPMTDLTMPAGEDETTVTTSRSALRSPVVAIDTSGRRILAAIDTVARWPTFVESDGLEVPFPRLAGVEGETTDLAMVAGPNGLVHAVWTTGRALYYGRLHPDGAGRSEAVRRLQDERASAPTLAVSDWGDVFIVFVDGHISREPNIFVSTYRGSVEQGFAGPMRVMPECCDTWTGDAWYASIGTVRYDGGLVRFGYSWGDQGGGWSSYVEQGRGFYEYGRVESAGYADHAGAIMPPGLPGLLTLNLEQDRLQLTSFGRVPQPTTVLEAPGLGTTHVAQDEVGQKHVVVTEMSDERRDIHYLREYEAGRWSKHILVGAALDQTLELTPRAGGLVVTDTRVYVPYTVYDADREPVSIAVADFRKAK
jgi:hypothetical protein